jgi:release factor glutamine methyltransferase
MIPTVAQRLAAAAQRLTPVSDTPRLDAELLLAHALGCTRSKLLARLRDTVEAPTFESLLERRLGWEPIAYILGSWEFFSLEFLVRPPMLVPRPETEHLVEVGLECLHNVAPISRWEYPKAQTQRFDDTLESRSSPSPSSSPPLTAAQRAPVDVLELGCGTGCVAITLSKNLPNAHITATDINPEALALTQENAQRHQAALDLRLGDLFDALGPERRRFDLIVSNPPYIEEGDWAGLSPTIRLHEDPGALLAGADGLDTIRRIIADAPNWLKPGGWLALEISERQRDAVAALLDQAGFEQNAFRPDLAGIPRIAYGQHP